MHFEASTFLEERMRWEGGSTLRPVEIITWEGVLKGPARKDWSVRRLLPSSNLGRGPQSSPQSRWVGGIATGGMVGMPLNVSGQLSCSKKLSDIPNFYTHSH